MWFKYSKKIPNSTKLIRKSFQHFIVEYEEVRRLATGRVEGSTEYLFSDAEAAEYVVKDLFISYFTCNRANMIERFAQVLGQ